MVLVWDRNYDFCSNLGVRVIRVWIIKGGEVKDF